MEEKIYYDSTDNIKLCVLADGMGGYTGGEVASNFDAIAITITDVLCPCCQGRASKKG